MDAETEARIRSELEALRRDSEALREDLVALQRSQARLALMVHQERAIVSAALRELEPEAASTSEQAGELRAPTPLSRAA